MSGEDGRSRGCGLVRFSSEEEAAEAIETLTDTELDGRQIFVREDKGGKGGAKGGGRGGGKGKGKGDKGSKGGKGKGKGKGGGRMSKDNLDDDLDSYFGGKDAPPELRESRGKVAKGSLDDDLDSYFAGASKVAARPCDADRSATGHRSCPRVGDHTLPL